MAKSRFLINKGGVFYLTTGKLLIYDPSSAKGEEQKKGVKDVETTFKRIRNEPHTWYEAVEVKDSSFSPVQTDQIA